jgi:hypothetical protein
MRWPVLIPVVIATVMAACGSKPTPKEAAPLAQCLQDRGVKMYGASWCPHCAAQKAAFGDAYPSAIYVECSNADHVQNDTCNALGIKGYPTWIFPNGDRAEGEQTLAALAAEAGC